MLSFLRKYSWLILLLGAAAYFIGRYFYMMPKYTNGTPAPAISAQLIDGSSFELTQLKGQYVLLDFWGSWCGPCRQQSPALRRLHQSFRQASFTDGEGLAIVSIGIEKDSSRWQRAIQADQLNWPYHIMDASDNLRFFNSPIAQAYGIKEVPTSYLLNPQGDIIGVNMEPDQVERLLQQRLPN